MADAPGDLITLNSEQVAELGQRLCNWDRWGSGDQRGTLNHISRSAVVAAANLVRTGEVIELGIPFDRSGPAVASPRRFNPLHFMMITPSEAQRDGDVGMADDVLVLPLQCGTQWDSLAHVSHRGLLYGGRPASSVSGAGAAVNDICNATGIASRGVLLDVAHANSTPCLPDGYAIEAQELARVAAVQGVEVRPGDVLLVRTGHLPDRRADGWRGFAGEAPGLAMSTLEWLHDHQVAAVATDTYALEVKPYQSVGHASPFHTVGIVYMGLLLGEIFDLEPLAEACRAAERYEFFFAAPALPVTGGVGTPVNPYAIL